MDLSQARTLWEPQPGRLDTAGHGPTRVPPSTIRDASRATGAPAVPTAKVRASFRPSTTVDDVDRAVEALTV
ncbi:hypothetical protein ACQPYK_25910 [Streptosporangium sp. CA-135522]|uniref:hypothetical protein n=1 Tax=Streptosporangium sp. CA-135522 TaxID=3240072 RepID=UPI003D8BB36D